MSFIKQLLYYLIFIILIAVLYFSYNVFIEINNQLSVIDVTNKLEIIKHLRLLFSLDILCFSLSFLLFVILLINLKQTNAKKDLVILNKIKKTIFKSSSENTNKKESSNIKSEQLAQNKENYISNIKEIFANELDDNLIYNDLSNALNEFKKKQEDLIESEQKIIDEVSLLVTNETDIEIISGKLFKIFSDIFDIIQGEIFVLKDNSYKSISTYAFFSPEGKRSVFEKESGLIGQVAKQKQLLKVESIPEGYIQSISGLGGSKTNNLIVFPVIKEDIVVAVIEIATFKKITNNDIKIIENIAHIINKAF